MELESTQIESSGQQNDRKDDSFTKVEHSGVRRKLFQEDGADEAYQDFGSICDQSARNCRDMNRDIKSELKRENKFYNKERKAEVSVLLISNCKNVFLMKLIEDHSKIITSTPEVNHCFPDSAYRVASAKTFNLIIIDLNGDYGDNLLKTSLTVRSCTLTNQMTPIVALKHTDTFKDDLWKKYGITEIIYGPLYQSTIAHICERYLNHMIKRDSSMEEKIKKNSSTSSTKQEEFKVPSARSLEINTSKNPWTSSRIESPVAACDSTEQITPYCETGNADVTVQVQVEDESRFGEEKAPSAPVCSSAFLTTGQTPFGTYSTSCLAPMSASTNGRQLSSDCAVNNNGAVAQVEANGSKSSNSSGWNVIQQILDLHQNAQKEIDQKPKTIAQPTENILNPVTKTVMSQPAVSIYPSVSQHASMMRSYPGHSIFTAPTLTHNAGYMINGTPGTANMKLSIIPDEYAKHSNKERERRERIKDSCDELRKILPKQLLSGRRQDMATVLEMTVYYLKVVQDHIPTVIQQQLYQTFVTYTDGKTRRKRKGTEMTQSVPCMLQNKYQRLQTATTSTASNGCYNGSHGTPTYLPQMLPSNSHQQSNIGYYSSMYHSLFANPYHATISQSSAPQPVYGSASLPSLDHVMHLRSQYYNDTMQPQNGFPCYLAVTSASRDTNNSNVQRIDSSKLIN